jgi:hypothetical protein
MQFSVRNLFSGKATRYAREALRPDARDRASALKMGKSRMLQGWTLSPVV